MSGLYAGASQLAATTGINWTGGTFAIMLVGAGYTPDYGADATLNDIPSIAQLLVTPTALSGETAAAGACGAAPLVYETLTITSPVLGIAILQNNGGAQSTWPLIAYIDQGDGFGQTVTAQPATIAWDARGIFQP